MLPEDKTFYQRNLPHIQPPGTVLFITFRLAGSLPAEAVAALRLERLQAEEAAAQGDAKALRDAAKRYFRQWDAALDHAVEGPHWLKQPEVAGFLEAELRNLAAQGYFWLLGYCIMSNHVHLLLRTPEPLTAPFHKTLQLLKGRTARAANLFLGRSGSFWQNESYDHAAFDGAEARRILAYIVNNPVKAGLTANWQHWPHTYAHPDAW